MRRVVAEPSNCRCCGSLTSLILVSSHIASMHIALESVDQPDVILLIDALDAYQTSLYPAESNHLLDIASLKLANVLFAVARESAGSTAIGCGAVVLMGDYGELKRMYINPAQRGRGIAKAIMQFLEQEIARCQCSNLRLETGIHQAEALGLYERAGYVRRGPYGDYPYDPLSVFMQKKISPLA